MCVNVSLCRNKGLVEVKDRPERTKEKRSILQCSVSSSSMETAVAKVYMYIYIFGTVMNLRAYQLLMEG